MQIIKKIIIRILVSVSVAFILFKMNLLGIMKVNALTYVNKIPSNITTFQRDGSSNGTANVVNFSANNTIFYGQQFTPQNGQNVETISFNYLNSSTSFYRLKSTIVQFVFFSTATNFSNEPYQFYIRDSVNSISTCQVESSRKYPSNNYIISDSLLSDLYSTVYCPNVFISGDNFQVYATGTAQNSVGQTFSFGISSLSIMLKDDTEQVMNDIKNNTKETNDFLKDDTEISNDTFTELFDSDSSWSDTPVSDLVSLPIGFLQSFYDGFNSQCQSISLGNLYGTNLVLPCIDLENLLGSNLWFLIDMMFSLFLSYNIIMMCISIFDSITSLEDGFNSLYSPRHGPREYIPKHGR